MDRGTGGGGGEGGAWGGGARTLFLGGWGGRAIRTGGPIATSGQSIEGRSALFHVNLHCALGYAVLLCLGDALLLCFR